MKRKIIRVGSSRGVLLPREVTRAMNWKFGSEAELTVDEEEKQIVLKTIKVDIPDDFNGEQLKGLEDILIRFDSVLGGIDD